MNKVIFTRSNKFWWISSCYQKNLNNFRLRHYRYIFGSHCYHFYLKNTNLTLLYLHYSTVLIGKQSEMSDEFFWKMVHCPHKSRDILFKRLFKSFLEEGIYIFLDRTAKLSFSDCPPPPPFWQALAAPKLSLNRGRRGRGGLRLTAKEIFESSLLRKCQKNLRSMDVCCKDVS